MKAWAHLPNNISAIEKIIYHIETSRMRNLHLQLVSSSALVDELMRRPENLKLKYFLVKMTLCGV